VCNFSDTDVEEDVDVTEELFISINEEVDRGIKQEEIPGDITFRNIKSEPDEVSYFCSCLLLDTFYRVGQWEGGSVLVGSEGGRFCTGWVGAREGLFWMGWWEGESVLHGWVGGRVCTGWAGREGRSVTCGSVGGRVCTGWAGGSEGM